MKKAAGFLQSILTGKYELRWLMAGFALGEILRKLLWCLLNQLLQ